MDTKGGGSLLPVLEQIERDKGIKKEEIIQMVESSLVSAYRKQYGKNVNVTATIDVETSEIKVALIKRVVETVGDPLEEITPQEAKDLKIKTKVGEEVSIPINTEDFSRIAAQIAKQVIIQKVREVERTSLFEEFSGKEGNLVSGVVQRFADRNIIVDLGKAEAIMPVREQVRRERFNVGERIKVLLVKVDRGTRSPQILVSRSHPDLVKRLLELEVPEVNEKVVEVVGIVRDPGFRSKIAVRSNNLKVDPVGTCVGVRGSRIRPVIDELRGERIDLVPYSIDAEKYISASMSPAKVLSVSVARDAEKRAEVIVGDDMYSLAIGKNGQNVRLASQLTGWNIDVRSESQRKEEAAKNLKAAQKELGELEGVGERTAEVLIKGGWGMIPKLANAKPEELTAFQGIGEKTAEKIIESAKAVMEKRKEAQTEGEVIQNGAEPESEDGQKERKDRRVSEGKAKAGGKSAESEEISGK